MSDLDESALKSQDREPVVETEGKIQNAKLREQLLAFLAKFFYYTDQENIDVTIGLDNWNVCVSNLAKELQSLATAMGRQQKVRSLLKLIPVILSMSATLDLDDSRVDVNQAKEEEGLDILMSIIGKSHFDAIKNMVILKNVPARKDKGPIKREDIEQSVTSLADILGS